MPLQQLQQQIDTLVRLDYPNLLAMDPMPFRAALDPLTRHVPAGTSANNDSAGGALSFVLVINTPLAPVRATLPLVERSGKRAIERLFPKESEQFKPIEAVMLPTGHAYLLLDIDRGADTLNVTPDDALDVINGSGRSPLTLEEGVALLTHFPEFLQPNHCFSMLASRCGDKRVPALWLSQGRPKLGWCWAGNPHSWLGSASCGARSSSVELHTH